jgi:L-ectoine synthase
MIVKTYEDLEGTRNETVLGGGRAVTRRFLLEEDGIGITVSDIRIKPGEGAQLWYKNHIEANYVIEGEGTLTELDTGKTHELRPGVMYCLDKHDRHRIVTKTPMRMICVFTPALAGGEVHDEDGAYPASASRT